MQGRARAPGAGTILNALATGIGSAFAIDVEIAADVTLTADSAIVGHVEGAPGADTALIERCAERVIDEFGDGQGAQIQTSGELPMAAGLKSSSAAANATVLATLSALDRADAVSREDAARIGVAAARDVGVTVTGAFDDASASMLGGVTVTDNTEDELLHHEERAWNVLIWTPPETAYSADADVERCQRIAPVAELIAELAIEGSFTRAMSVNGFVYCAALGFDPEPMVEAFPEVSGVSLSGTGPSFVAVGDRAALETVEARWARRVGSTIVTTTQTEGATVDA